MFGTIYSVTLEIGFGGKYIFSSSSEEPHSLQLLSSSDNLLQQSLGDHINLGLFVGVEQAQIAKSFAFEFILVQKLRKETKFLRLRTPWQFPWPRLPCEFPWQNNILAK